MLTPVVLCLPVFNDLLHGFEWNAILPLAALDLIRPPRAGQTGLEVTKDHVGNLDSERVDLLAIACARCEAEHCQGKGAAAGRHFSLEIHKQTPFSGAILFGFRLSLRVSEPEFACKDKGTNEQ